LRDNQIKKSEVKLGSYKGTTFTQLENERANIIDKEKENNVNIPLKNIEPAIQPRL
jgi:hypothetical protein